MDLEELSKQQIVLLAVLVSFVTSIGTGIVTASLINKAPTSVTQPVNRVVERTVERVVPSQTNTPKEVTKEKTVVVEQSSRISDAVRTARDGLVRIYSGTEDNTSESKGQKELISYGVIVDEAGILVADGAAINQSGQYYGILTDGTRVDLGVVEAGQNAGIASLRIQNAENVVFAPIEFADQSAFQVGQQVIALAGRDDIYIRSGIISQLQDITPADSSNGTSTEEAAISPIIKTSINAPSPIVGAPVINMFGKLVGLYHTQSNTIVVSPSNTVAEAVKAASSGNSVSASSTAVND